MSFILLPFLLISQLFAGNPSLEAMNSVLGYKLGDICDAPEKTFGKPTSNEHGIATFKSTISGVKYVMECHYDAKGAAGKIRVKSGPKYTQNQDDPSELVKEFGQPHFISGVDLSLNYKFEEGGYLSFFIDSKTFKISYYELEIYPDFISRKEVPLHDIYYLKKAVEKKLKAKKNKKPR